MIWDQSFKPIKIKCRKLCSGYDWVPIRFDFYYHGTQIYIRGIQTNLNQILNFKKLDLGDDFNGTIVNRGYVEIKEAKIVEKPSMTSYLR